MASTRVMSRSAGISETMKAVETLFETQTVVEIREVETKTRTDIEEKQKQLRLLVGNSYRDLISSADTILEMAKTCDTVLANVSQLQEGLSGLAGRTNQGDDLQAKGQEASRRRALHAIGGRIKYLVDTPEMIWGCLDTHSYLDAARRFMRAAEVHRQLQKLASAKLGAKFPLVRRQWPNIQKFRSHIEDHVSQRLNQQELLTAEDCATALAAAATLQDLDSSAGLSRHLESRQVAIKEVIERVGGEGGSQQSPTAAADALGEAVRQVQETVWQVGRLFLDHEGSGRTALLPLLLEEEGVSGELLFGALHDKPDSDPALEAEAWKAHSAAIRERIKPLTQQQTSQAVSKFLQDMAGIFGSSGRLLMAAHCSTAADLAGLEAGLQSSISRWKHEGAGQSFPGALMLTETLRVSRNPTEGEADSLRSPRRSLQPSTPKRGARSPGGFEEELPSSWDASCEWVLTKRASLWDMILEPSFVQVGQDLIEKGLQALKQAVRSPLTACLQSAESAAPAPPGGYRTLRWPEAATDDSVPGRKRARYTKSGHLTSPTIDDAASWRQQLPHVQRDFNERLRSVLSDTILLLSDQAGGKEPQLRRGYSGRSFPMPPSQSKGRAAVLQSFLKQSCMQAALDVREELASLLDRLSDSSEGVEAASTVEQALLIGRLCFALGSTETLLPVILGSPEGWKEALHQLGSARFPGIGGGQAKPRSQASKSSFPELQESFRTVAVRAHKRWAVWAASALGQELEKAISADAALISAVPLRVWEETVVSQEGEEGDDETRFQLPAMPSASVMMCLLGTGRELQRAGGSLPASPALRVLQSELAGAVLEAFSAALKPASALEQKLSEKGVLQLLFDLRFLKDVVLGSKVQVSTGGQQANTASAVNQQKFAHLESTLQDRLDPIDWAIYGAYLWQNEAAFYKRVRVLFGSLLLSSTVHTEVLSKGTTSVEANILRFAPTTARFGYLPISTPSATASGLRQLPPTGTARAGPEEAKQNNDYSFANLGGMKAGSSLEREAESAASTAFEALQSRFTSQRLGALGSLLGDRAAEVTAMAQQSFSDISLPTAFTSALGSSGGGATGLLASFRGFRGGTEAE